MKTSIKAFLGITVLVFVFFAGFYVHTIHAQSVINSSTFTRDLTIGSKGTDVTALQDFLIANGYLAKDNNTGYFGNLTQAALSSYQFANGIVPASGYFGQSTISFILSHTNTPSPGPVPPYYQLSVSKTGSGYGTVVSGDGGINCGNICVGAYNPYTLVTIQATPSVGSKFDSWSGTACSGASAGICIVTMSQAQYVTAKFISNNDITPPPPTKYQLSVTKIGSGSGTVRSNNVAGIDCGSDCSETYNSGTSVTLAATPSSNSDFSGWVNPDSVTPTICVGTNFCTVTMDASKNIFANFTLHSDSNPPPPSNQYTLSVSKAGNGSGTIRSGDGRINCGSTCSYSYNSYALVTLQATESSDSIFDSWSGTACSGASAGICIVTMSQAQNITATFDDTSSSGGGGGGGGHHGGGSSGGSSNDSGCDGVHPFSTTTGHPCTYPGGGTIPAGCFPGYNFSILNGLPCPLSVTGTYIFNQNLFIGINSQDVLQLQKYLNSHGSLVSTFGLGSPGYETVHFGPKTQQAVAAFQRAHGIVPAYGYFGPITRAYVNNP